MSDTTQLLRTLLRRQTTMAKPPSEQRLFFGLRDIRKNLLLGLSDLSHALSGPSLEDTRLLKELWMVAAEKAYKIVFALRSGNNVRRSYLELLDAQQETDLFRHILEKFHCDADLCGSEVRISQGAMSDLRKELKGFLSRIETASKSKRLLPDDTHYRIVSQLLSIFDECDELLRQLSNNLSETVRHARALKGDLCPITLSIEEIQEMKDKWTAFLLPMDHHIELLESEDWD